MGVSAAGDIESEAARERTHALYREYGRTVASICRALLRDRSEAEDAAQQVFLSAHRALLHGAAPREPAAWLGTIARNECRARIRSRMTTPLAASTDAVDRAAPDPPTEAIQRAELAAFWQALADLPRSQREAVVLREIRGLSYDQLAEHLALSHPSVRSLLRRARQRIRLHLHDVHSGLGGISWIETVARLFTGGGNPVAPVAKVAALGLGAAALTGGAVVSPEILDHHVNRANAPRVLRQATRHSPSLHTTRSVGRRGVAALLPTAAVDRRRRHRDDRVRHDRANANKGPGDGGVRTRGGHASSDGEQMSARGRGGDSSDSRSSSDGDSGGTTMTTATGASSEGEGSRGSGDGSSMTPGSGEQTGAVTSGESASSSSSDGGGGSTGDSGAIDSSGDSGSSGGD